MAKKKVVKRKVGRPFKKGNTAAKGHGRPKLTPEQKAMCLSSRTQFKLLLSQYSALTLDEIKKHIKEKKLPVLDMAVLKHLQEMVESGSMQRVDWLADHVLGKAKEVSHVKVSGGMGSSIDLKSLSKEDLVLLKNLIEKSDNES